MDYHQEERLLGEKVKEISMVKVFNLYQQRNEWLNWDGDTGIVNRGRNSVKLTLESAEQSAEIRRTQGSKFHIAEIPALCVSTKSGFLLCTELFTSKPLDSFSIKSISNDSLKNLRTFQKCFLPSKWSVIIIYDHRTKFTKSDSTYFHRSSSPGESLCWSLRYEKIDESKIAAICNKVNKKLSREMAI